jgi:hypothetical protein
MNINTLLINDISNDYSDEIIEDINYNNNYTKTKCNQIYKIFNDITDIKTNNDTVELQIMLNKSNDIITLNNIILSDNIKKLLHNCYISYDTNTIIPQDKIKNKIFIFKKKLIQNHNCINCYKNNAYLHLIFKSKSLESLLNSYIYISYNFYNIKNKLKIKSNKSVDLIYNDFNNNNLIVNCPNTKLLC